MFSFVSGHRALDFAGTVQARIVDPTDLLTTPARLADWCVAAGFLDEPPACDAIGFERALRLREALYRMASAAALTRPVDPADRALLNEMARGDLPILELTDQLPSGTAVHRSGTLDTVLTALSRIGIELLGGPERARIKECGRPDCTRLYLDTSRAGSRRWCDMTVCGNRAKSAAFRTRRDR